jgi:hypothetical protein
MMENNKTIGFANASYWIHEWDNYNGTEIHHKSERQTVALVIRFAVTASLILGGT